MNNRNLTAASRSTEQLVYAKSINLKSDHPRLKSAENAPELTEKSCSEQEGGPLSGRVNSCIISRNFCQQSIAENFCIFRLFTWTMLIFSVLAVLFLAFPEIDLYVANIFYSGNHQFLFQAKHIAPYAKTVRFGLQLVFAAGCLGAGLLFLYSLWNRSRFNAIKTIFNRAGRTSRKTNAIAMKTGAFLLLAFVLGPGIMANMVFKDNWGRARPNQVIEFGGTKPFTPPLLMRENCERNCSFVSGEASTIYMLFFALSLVLRRWRYQLIIAGLIAGTFSGLVRMGLGGHFLSDVLFAGIFMSFTALFSYWLVFGAAFKTSPLSPTYQSLWQRFQNQLQNRMLKNVYPIGTIANLPTYQPENQFQE